MKEHQSVDANDKFPEELLRLAQEYRVPERIPVEAMWSTVAKELDRGAGRGVQRGRKFGVWGAIGWLAAAGLVLAVGVGIGRVAESDRGAAEVATGQNLTSLPVARNRTVAVKEIDALEPLLSMVASDARSGTFDPQVGVWAERVLVRTRLLQDASASDPALEELLKDLELVLMQIASLEGMDRSRGQEELALIAQGLQSKNMMGRIRSVAALGP